MSSFSFHLEGYVKIFIPTNAGFGIRFFLQLLLNLSEIKTITNEMNVIDKIQI